MQVLYSVCCMLVLAALFIPAKAFAVTVSPASFRLEIAPGTNAQGAVKLTNDRNERQTFSLIVENFVASGEEGAQTYIREDEPTDLASWVFVERPSVTIDPGETVEFPFIISVPQDAEPGGHYATLFFSRSAGQASASGVGITEQVGALLLVRVPGDIREEANVESFRLVNGPWPNRLPAEFELRIRNTGSVHLEPTGIIVIRNLLGSVVARVPANPTASNVLPNSVRKIESAWVKGDVSEGGFWAETVNEWRNFAIGRYTATIEAAYGSRGTPLSGPVIRFWVLPWRLLFLVFGAFLLVILLAKGYHALIVRAALRKSRKGKRHFGEPE